MIKNYDLFDSVDFILSSDLRRAIETSKIINSYMNLELRESSLLRERNFGILEGNTEEENIKNNLSYWNNFKNHDLKCHLKYGENLIEFQNRIKDFLEFASKNFTNKRVICVSHGAFIKMVVKTIKHYPITESSNFSIKNCSITKISFYNNQWYVDFISDIKHLSHKKAA